MKKKQRKTVAIFFLLSSTLNESLDVEFRCNKTVEIKAVFKECLIEQFAQVVN